MAGVRIVFLLKKMQTGLWSPNSLKFNNLWGYLLEVKRLEFETNHLSPPSAEVKNVWSYTSSYIIRRYSVFWDRYVARCLFRLKYLFQHFYVKLPLR
jgi:hypothetical protein